MCHTDELSLAPIGMRENTQDLVRTYEEELMVLHDQAWIDLPVTFMTENPVVSEHDAIGPGEKLEYRRVVIRVFANQKWPGLLHTKLGIFEKNAN